MKRILVVLALLSAAPALAQVPPGAPPIPQPQPSPSPAPSLEQLVKERFGQDALAGLVCQASAASLKSQLEAAQAKIKEMETKSAPSKP